MELRATTIVAHLPRHADEPHVALPIWMSGRDGAQGQVESTARGSGATRPQGWGRQAQLADSWVWSGQCKAWPVYKFRAEKATSRFGKGDLRSATASASNRAPTQPYGRSVEVPYADCW